MSKGIILYQSKYGATEKYANWLREATGFDLLETKRADISQVLSYDTVILGGGVYASGIAGISFLKKNFARLQGKRIAVFCVGMSPCDGENLEQIRQLNLSGDMSDIPLFYCRGACDPGRMTFLHRLLCRMLRNAVAKKPAAERNPLEESMLTVGDSSVDWTDRKYLEALTEWVGKAE